MNKVIIKNIFYIMYSLSCLVYLIWGDGRVASRFLSVSQMVMFYFISYKFSLYLVNKKNSDKMKESTFINRYISFVSYFLIGVSALIFITRFEGLNIIESSLSIIICAPFLSMYFAKIKLGNGTLGQP